MKNVRIFAALLVATSLSAPVIAQVGDINSQSASGAEANSGSVSGAQSDNNSSQAQQQNNAGIGNSDSVSNSNSDAVSGSISGAESNGNQQGQSQGLNNANQLGATQGNQQGVTVNQTWNSTNRKVTEVRTNAAVPLAASSSFSSDYCGGTTSGGASVAPLGVSIGAASPTFDRSCRYLRVAEKAGMLGANYHNMQQVDMSLKAMSLMAWALCMAGPEQDKRKEGYKENVTMEACLRLGLLGSETSPISPPSPPPAPAPEPTVQSNGYPTPEAVERYKTPRGELEFRSQPVIQEVPIASAVK